MSNFFVNLPISHAHDRPRFTALFEARRLNPELGIDARAIEGIPRDWHESFAARLDAAGLTRGVHLPFFDLHPASFDPLILDASRERLRRGIELAKLYAPAHLVGHATLPYGVPYELTPRLLETAADTWSSLLDAWPGHPPLVLENTYELDPDLIVQLIDRLAARGHDVGACFDVGHWHSFAQGVVHKDLRRWVDALGNRVRHLHLHDNTGAGDQHLGLGYGLIPFDELFALLDTHGLTPTVAFEPHNEPAHEETVVFVRNHPEWFARLGISLPTPGPGGGPTPAR